MKYSRRNKKDSQLPNYFCEGNTILTKNDNIANCFNRFLSNIGPELAGSIKGPEGKSYEDYLKQIIFSSFSFETVDSGYVMKRINELKSKSSFGHDGLSSILLKRNCIANNACSHHDKKSITYFWHIS